MRRNISAFLVLTLAILVSVSFMFGMFYERQLESRNILDLDRSLVLLLARPTDFEITGSQWQLIEYDQTYYEPKYKGVSSEYEIARKHFSTSFPNTHASFNVSHEIRRYSPDELPKTTWIDDVYLGENATTYIEIHLLDLKELDDNTRAFCVLAEIRASITCFVESKYTEIVSTLTFDGYNMEESQIIGFMAQAIQKFYYRLSQSAIQ